MIIAGSLHENKEEAMEEKMIAFPATTEAFIAYQEAGIGRKLEKLERKLASAVVELANISYQEGIEGTENTITMKAVKAFFLSRPNRAASGCTGGLVGKYLLVVRCGISGREGGRPAWLISHHARTRTARSSAIRYGYFVGATLTVHG